MVVIKKRSNGQWRVLSGAPSNALPADAPTSVALASPTAGVLRATWVAPAFNGNSDITKYEVKVSVSGGALVQTVYAGPTDTDTLILGLTTGVAYTATVAAVNSAGTGLTGLTSSCTVTSATSYTLPGGLIIPSGWANPATIGIFGSGKTYGDLTPFDGTLTTTADNQIIQDLDIRGDINIMHQNVIIRRCRVHSVQTSPVVTGGSGVVNGNNSLIVGGNRVWLANHTQVRYCEIIGSSDPNLNDQSGITSGGSLGFITEYNIIRNASDAITLNDEATVTGNLVYEMKVEALSHADCFQITDGINTTVQDNVLFCHQADGIPVMGGDGVQRVDKSKWGNAAIQLGAQTGELTGLLINHNYISGGTYGINANRSGEAVHGNMQGAFTNNVFSGYQKYGPVAQTGTDTTFDDSNVWEATRVTNTWSGPGDSVERYYHLTAGSPINGTTTSTTP